MKPLFELLICGLSSRFEIPEDIILLINKYHTTLYDLPLNLFVIQNYVTFDETFEAFNIPRSKILNKTCNKMNNFVFIRPDTPSSTSTMGSTCTIHNDTLPSKTQIECENESVFKFSKELTHSNKWSMVIKIGHCCHLNAFHTNIFAEYAPYGMYKFPIPTFSASYYATMVYNRYNKILYAMNTQSSGNTSNKVYGLDFKQIEWKWNVLSSDIIQKRQSTAACMVNNNKYIAILGGHQYFEAVNDVELYDCYEDKTIKLSNMCHKRKNAVCKYSEVMNKIVVVDRHYNSLFRTGRPVGSIEYFDMEKNKWIIIDIGKTRWGDLRDIYLSHWNPYVLQLIGYDLNTIVVNVVDVRDSKRNNVVNMFDKHKYKVFDEEFCTICL